MNKTLAIIASALIIIGMGASSAEARTRGTHRGVTPLTSTKVIHRLPAGSGTHRGVTHLSPHQLHVLHMRHLVYISNR